MSVRQIIQSFEAWGRSGESMVMATVYDTLGSTYTKAGHRILIAGNGDYQGLVSGGCLEGDLADRARDVLDLGRAEAVTYDMRDEADDLWGLGVGCNGLIRVFLQPLNMEEGYQPFAGICERLLENRPATVATVIESKAPDTPPGATLIWEPEHTESWQLTARAAQWLVERCETAQGAGRASYEIHNDGLAVLYAPLKRVPRLLVLGAGLDALPVVDMASELGWRVTVADHRPAYLQKGGFDRADRAILVDPTALEQTLALDGFDAVIVMSHHLATDRIYLEKLSRSNPVYLGVLGPPARRARLVDELGDAGVRLRSTLKGPVGLDIGADSPESIALSLLAEIHASLEGASGSALTKDQFL